MDLKTENIKCVKQTEREREGGRGVVCVKRDKSNSSRAQATASGGKQCPFCPNKPHQDSWHEGRGIDISSRYAVCCPPGLGKEKRWFHVLHSSHCCWSWALKHNLRLSERNTLDGETEQLSYKSGLGTWSWWAVKLVTERGKQVNGSTGDTSTPGINVRTVKYPIKSLRWIKGFKKQTHDSTESDATCSKST